MARPYQMWEPSILRRTVWCGMRVGHIELFCKDCAKTKAFYVDLLGFDEVEVQGGKFVWLRCEDLELLLRPGSPPSTRKTYTDSASALVVYCDDVAELQERMESMGIPLTETDDVPDGLTFCDPDGRWLQAVEQ